MSGAGLSRRAFCSGAAAGLALTGLRPAWAWEPRDMVDFLRGPYNEAFYFRHNHSYRIGAAMHFFHSKQHDLLMQTPLAEHARYDQLLNTESLDFLHRLPRTEPTMMYYSEYADRTVHTVFRAIDWTHIHHEQTYDIMADRDIVWADKKRWTDRAVRYYLTEQTAGVPRSCAPLDVTMRRAAVMMKPYFTLFRNYYPVSNNLFFVAHWWHPATYEAIMIAGNGDGQEAALAAKTETMWRELIPEEKRPVRMVWSREIMPRYSRMSPESANIFDNLHMLHGIVYDILAYEKWSLEEKRAELYRVIHAMGYQPGDEKLARKFTLPHPEIDPRVVSDWIRSPEGEMSRVMKEMLMEMMPLMMPDATPDMRMKMMALLKQKTAPGLEPGEPPGSLADAMMAMMPGMKMDPEAMAPGVTPTKMVDAMLAGWRSKYGNLPDIPLLDLSREPSLSPHPASAAA